MHYLTIALSILLTWSAVARADTLTLRPDVNLAGCNAAAAKSVEGKCVRESADPDAACKTAGDPPKEVPLPVPSCSAYLTSLMEQASAEWAAEADATAIRDAMANPAKRKRLVTESRR